MPKTRLSQESGSCRPMKTNRRQYYRGDGTTREEQPMDSKPYTQGWNVGCQNPPVDEDGPSYITYRSEENFKDRTKTEMNKKKEKRTRGGKAQFQNLVRKNPPSSNDDPYHTVYRNEEKFKDRTRNEMDQNKICNRGGKANTQNPSTSQDGPFQTTFVNEKQFGDRTRNKMDQKKKPWTKGGKPSSQNIPVSQYSSNYNAHGNEEKIGDRKKNEMNQKKIWTRRWELDRQSPPVPQNDSSQTVCRNEEKFGDRTRIKTGQRKTKERNDKEEEKKVKTPLTITKRTSSTEDRSCDNNNPQQTTDFKPINPSHSLDFNGSNTREHKGNIIEIVTIQKTEDMMTVDIGSDAEKKSNPNQPNPSYTAGLDTVRHSILIPRRFSWIVHHPTFLPDVKKSYVVDVFYDEIKSKLHIIGKRENAVACHFFLKTLKEQWIERERKEQYNNDK